MGSLINASRAGDTERVKQLLDAGALLDEKDTDGDTALMLASLEGHTEVVKLLLDKGASVDEKDEGGKKNFHAQREESDSRFDRQREEVQTVKAEVQKVEAELQKQREAIHEVHAKLDETIQLVRNLG